MRVGSGSVRVGSGSVQVGIGSVQVGSASVRVGSGSVQVGIGSVQVGSGSVQVGSGSVQEVRGSRLRGVADLAPFRRRRIELKGNPSGTACAPRYGMKAAKRYEDLLVWQLGDQIRVLAFKLTERDCFARDLKLHSQTEDAVNSVCRNIAEGFGCKHKEFARYLEISRRSLNEMRDSFRTAQLKRYVTPHEYEPIWRLTQRLYPALGRLIRYLQTTPDPDWTRPKVTRAQQPERARTDPAQPARTDPAQPTRTDPAQPTRTDPA